MMLFLIISWGSWRASN